MDYKTEVLQRAVKTYGPMYQTVKAAEELSELLVELNKWLGMSENEEHIREECADAEIMLGQLRIIFGDWSGWTHDKMDRLEDRINAINGTKENDC